MKSRMLCLFATIFVVTSVSVFVILNDDQNDVCGDDTEFMMDGIVYHILGNDVEVTGTNISGPMIIPPSVEYNGNIYKVSAIQDSAAEGKEITELYVPFSVDFLGDRCFADCKQLQSVNLSSNTLKTGVGMFMGCSSLKKVEIKNTVSTISAHTFNSGSF